MESEAFLLAFQTFLHLFFFATLCFLSAWNMVLTCCDQRGGTNWVNTLTYTQQKAKQGSAPKVTKEKDDTDHSIRLNRVGICIWINRFVSPGCVPSVELLSVAKLLHRPRWRVTRGKRRRGALEREGVQQSDWDWEWWDREKDRLVGKRRWVWWHWVERVVRENDWMWEVKREKASGSIERQNNNLKLSGKAKKKPKKSLSSNLTENLWICCICQMKAFFSTFLSFRVDLFLFLSLLYLQVRSIMCFTGVT